MQNVQFETKRSTRKLNVGAKACTERDKIGESQIRFGIRDSYPWGKTSNQLSSQLVKEKDPRIFFYSSFSDYCQKTHELSRELLEFLLAERAVLNRKLAVRAFRITRKRAEQN